MRVVHSVDTNILRKTTRTLSKWCPGVLLRARVGVNPPTRRLGDVLEYRQGLPVTCLELPLKLTGTQSTHPCRGQTHR